MLYSAPQLMYMGALIKYALASSELPQRLGLHQATAVLVTCAVDLKVILAVSVSSLCRKHSVCGVFACNQGGTSHNRRGVQIACSE